jgi:hypothetical protein
MATAAVAPEPAARPGRAPSGRRSCRRRRHGRPSLLASRRHGPSALDHRRSARAHGAGFGEPVAVDHLPTALGALIASAADEIGDLVLQRPLEDQPRAEPGDRLDRVLFLTDAVQDIIKLAAQPLAGGYLLHAGVPPSASTRRSKRRLRPPYDSPAFGTRPGQSPRTATNASPGGQGRSRATVPRALRQDLPQRRSRLGPLGAAGAGTDPRRRRRRRPSPSRGSRLGSDGPARERVASFERLSRTS